MHTMERYFNHSDNMELTDGISEVTDAYGDQKCKNPCKRDRKIMMRARKSCGREVFPIMD